MSNIGDGLTLTALPWLATTVTSNALYVSLIPTAMRLPWLLFSLPAGVLIDLLPRKRLMVLMNMGRAVITALLAIFVFRSQVTWPLLTLMAFLFGTTGVMFNSTTQTVVPSIVERSGLERANGLLNAAQLITSDILGRPVGGLLITIALYVPFAVDTLTSTLSTLLLLPIGGLSHTSNTKRRLQLREDLLEGIRYVWQHPLLRGLALLSIGTNVMYSAVLATQILFIRDILGINSFGFGLLLSAAALSSILGSQSVTWLRDRVGTKNTLIISMLAIGISLGLVGVSSQWEVVGVLYMVEGFFVVVSSVLNLSIRQRLVPDHLLGRTGGVFRFLSWGVSPLGMLLGGFLVTGGEPVLGRALALRSPFLLTGIVYGVLAFAALRLLPTESIAD